MKSNTFVIVLSLTALFVFGGVCGVGLSRNLRTLKAESKAEARPWSEEAWLERRYQEDVVRLKLTSEQAEKLQAHYRALAEDIRAVREDTIKRIRILVVRHMKAVVPDLTSEQRERYNKLSQERRAARR